MHRIESEAVAGNIMGISNVRPVFVYTPEEYEHTRRRYPVIYWIPGWKTPASSEYVGALDAAIAKGWIPPVIAVTVDVRGGVLMLNSPVFGDWTDFLIDEVVPFIDGEYRTIPSPKGRALMGHSTGGYGAMLLPLLYPGIWSAVGLNDASVWGACQIAWGRKSSRSSASMRRFRGLSRRGRRSRSPQRGFGLGTALRPPQARWRWAGSAGGVGRAVSAERRHATRSPGRSGADIHGRRSGAQLGEQDESLAQPAIGRGDATSGRRAAGAERARHARKPPPGAVHLPRRPGDLRDAGAVLRHVGLTDTGVGRSERRPVAGGRRL
ncbi:hypothetical protein HOK31_05190 [Candidatus Poribacteria bacterium]|nr:hypothetical protein [Candidatus Poribacteria bacterium]